jgi:AcrR family transcriptional regulator
VPPVVTAGGQESRGRGRPRSEAVRRAILDAAGELMLEGGWAAATIEAIAGRAGVSKATIYKWWPSRGAVALDGFLDRVRDTIAIPEGLASAEVLRFQVQSLIRLFRDSTSGSLMRGLIAQSMSDPDIESAVRERWIAPRRAVTIEVLKRGQETGELRPDTFPEVAADQLFAPVYHRLIFGHQTLDDDLADRLVEQLMTGIGSNGPGNN